MPSHYLNQCWPNSLMHICSTREDELKINIAIHYYSSLSMENITTYCHWECSRWHSMNSVHSHGNPQSLQAKIFNVLHLCLGPLNCTFKFIFFMTFWNFIAHFTFNIFAWNLSNKLICSHQGEYLTSLATVMSMHPGISSCLWVNTLRPDCGPFY